MKSMRKNVQAKFRIRGNAGNWVTIRVFVVCIQEKGISNPRFKNNCRLIFTLFVEGEDNPIRILYVTGNDGEMGHGGNGFDHIHLEYHVKNCGTERELGWPELPEIVNYPSDKI